MYNQTDICLIIIDIMNFLAPYSESKTITPKCHLNPRLNLNLIITLTIKAATFAFHVHMIATSFISNAA